MKSLAFVTVVTGMLILNQTVLGGEATTVCRVRVCSDNVPDVSSVDDLVKAVTKTGMSDAEKCLAVWDAYWRLRFPDAGAYAMLHGAPVNDPIIALTSFGNTICEQDATYTSALWAAMGYDVRFWQIVGHTVSEVFYNGRWHLLDGATGLYFCLEDNKTVAGVEDLAKWMPYDERCSNFGKTAKEKVDKEPGHLCLRHCPVCTDLERLKEHGYDLYGDKKIGPDKNNNEVQKIDEYEAGHYVNLTLRKGETWRACWGPLGTEEDYWVPSSGGKRVSDMWDLGKRYTEQRGGGQTNWGPRPLSFTIQKDTAYANGELLTRFDKTRFNKDLFEDCANAAFLQTGSALIGPKVPSQACSAVMRVDLPYVITGAWLNLSAEKPGKNDALQVEVSTDGGLTWKKVHDVTVAGHSENTIRLYPAVAGTFGYLVRFTISGSKGTGIGAIELRTVTMLNPFALPRLKAGENKITVDIGEQTATTFFYPNLGDAGSTKSFDESKGVRVDSSSGWQRGYHADSGGAALMKKIHAPGTVKRLVWGGRFRDSTKPVMEYSADGKTWSKQAWTWKYTLPPEKAWEGNAYPMMLETTPITQAVQDVFVRYSFGAPGFIATMLRVGCDYVPPGADEQKPPAVELTYSYKDAPGGQSVVSRFRVTGRKKEFTITVKGQQPVMEWYSLSVAEK